jgi:hypothetical protein
MQEDTAKDPADWIQFSNKGLNDFIFTGRKKTGGPISHVQHTRLIKEWVEGIGLNSQNYSTHSPRRTKSGIFYEQTKNPEACRQLLGQRTPASTLDYLGIKVDSSTA